MQLEKSRTTHAYYYKYNNQNCKCRYENRYPQGQAAFQCPNAFWKW